MTHYEQRKFVVPEIVVGYESSLLIGRYLTHFGSKKTMVVTDPGISAQKWFNEILLQIKAYNIAYVVFDEVTSNPKDYETMLGAELFLAENCDSIVAIGGGSPMDCAKGIGIVSTNGGHILDYVGVDEIRLPGPPLLCIPTTAGTSADVSQFAIVTDSQKHIKKAIISKKVVPDLALIDVVPLMTMDPYLTACTGMDALTHAIEAYVSTASGPLTDIHALKAIDLVNRNLYQAVQKNRTLETMQNMLLASLHAGFAFSNASLGAVHAMAHSLGGTLDLPHGECNSILLEHLVVMNHPYAKEKFKDIAAALGLETRGFSDTDVAEAIKIKLGDLRASVGIHATIISPHVSSEQWDEMVRGALDDPCMVTNPKSLTYEEVKGIYEQIFEFK